MLAGVGTHQTTCPPHAHQLNGVAERAIRSIMEQIRVNLVASNFPISFWTYAAQHGVDVLNRTTAPPDNDLTSFEVMHGEQPKVMGVESWFHEETTWQAVVANSLPSSWRPSP